MFPDVEYAEQLFQDEDVKTNNEPIIQPATLNIPVNVKAKNVTIMIVGRQIAIKLLKNENDIKFIMGLRYSRWDSKQYCWIVPNYPGNLDLIKDYFAERIKELVINDEIETTIKGDNQRIISKNDLLLIRTTTDRLKIISGYNKELIKTVRNIPFSNWNGKINGGVSLLLKSSLKKSELLLKNKNFILYMRKKNVIRSEKPGFHLSIFRITEIVLMNTFLS